MTNKEIRAFVEEQLSNAKKRKSMRDKETEKVEYAYQKGQCFSLQMVLDFIDKKDLSYIVDKEDRSE